MAAALALQKPPQENFSRWRRRARRNRCASPDRVKRKSRYRLRRTSGAPVSANGGHGTDFAKEVGGTAGAQGSVDFGEWRPDRPWGNASVDISAGSSKLQSDVAIVVGGTMATGAVVGAVPAVVEVYGWKKALAGAIAGVRMLVRAARPGADGLPPAEIPIPPSIRPTATKPVNPPAAQPGVEPPLP